MDNRTEALADGVWRVEAGPLINTYVLAVDGHSDAEGLTLVDTGTASAGARIVRSVRMLGFAPTAIRDVLLTHAHPDHAGSAQRFATSSAAPRVWIGALDLPVLRGAGAPVVRPAPDTTTLGRLLLGAAFRLGTVPGARPLADGHQHAAAGGVLVVATPGHTDGHVALHLPDRGVLLAGDALFNVLRLTRGPKFLSAQLTLRASTTRRLAGLEFDVLAVGHGPPIRRRARERVAALVG